MKNDTLSQNGLLGLRFFLGLLFVIPGIMKIMAPEMIAGMLAGMGVPMSGFFGWMVILSEILFGAALLAGVRVKYTVWPLVVILVVATFMVHIPGLSAGGMAPIMLLFHLQAIAALVALGILGPGAKALME